MLTLLLTAAMLFPRATSAEMPVSASPLTAAPNVQGPPIVASNGEIAFAVWQDQRDQFYRIMGTRVDRDGNPLDVAGIVLPVGGSIEALVWNGTAFALFFSDGSKRHAVFVGADGAIASSREVDVPYSFRFAAVSSSGTDARLLFIGGSTGSTETRIVNGVGDVVSSTFLPDPESAYFAAATGRRTDFLLLSLDRARRFNRKGELIASVASKAPFQFFPGASSLAGREGAGFILIAQINGMPGIMAYKLDEAGIFIGPQTSIVQSDPPYPNAVFSGTILPDGDHYLVVAQHFLGNGHSKVYLAAVGDDLSSDAHPVYDWVGITQGVAAIVADGPPLVFTSANRLYTSSNYDLFAQPLHASLDLGDPRVLAASATLQTNAVISLSSTGYAVAWAENGPDRYARIYVRRFSMSGTALEDAPVEVSRSEQDFSYTRLSVPTLISNGDVVLVNGRRMSALTGEWLDPAPITQVVAGASNGRDALVVTYTNAGIALQQVALFGTSSAPPVTLPRNVAYPVVASNGTDYLIVWTNVYECNISACPALPTPIYAQRVRADGTAIDSQPVTLSKNGSNPSVAWNGKTYLVAWSEASAVRGTRIRSDGAVVDLDGSNNGVVLDVGLPDYSPTISKLAAYGGDFLLFVRRMDNSRFPRTGMWTAARIDGDSEPGNVSISARTTIVSNVGDSYGMLNASSTSSRLVLTYDRSSEAATGRVPRVYVQQFSEPGVRRRAIAH